MREPVFRHIIPGVPQQFYWHLIQPIIIQVRGCGLEILGMKVVKDSDTLYCWLNMSASSGSATIYDVAVFNMETVAIPNGVVPFDEVLRITPNPFDDILKISFTEALDVAGEITIVGLDGRIVYSSGLPNGINTERIDLSKQPTGIYFLIFYDGQTNHFYKTIKNR